MQASDGELVWTNPVLGPREAGTLYVSAQVSSTLPLRRVLYTRARISTSDSETTYADNQASFTALVGQAQYDLQVQTWIETPTSEPGQPVVFGLRARNWSNLPIVGVVITDNLLGPIAYVSQTNPYTPSVATDQQVAWSLGELAAGEERTWYLTAVVSPTAPLGSPYTNTLQAAIFVSETEHENNFSAVMDRVY